MNNSTTPRCVKAGDMAVVVRCGTSPGRVGLCVDVLGPAPAGEFERGGVVFEISAPGSWIVRYVGGQKILGCEYEVFEGTCLQPIAGLGAAARVVGQEAIPA